MINFLLKEKMKKRRKKISIDEIYRIIYKTDKEIKKIKKEDKNGEYIIQRNIEISNLQDGDFNIEELANSYIYSEIYSGDYDSDDFNYDKINVKDTETDSNNILQMQLEYDENYTMMELKRIMEYYGLLKRRKNKATIIEELIMFETNIQNQIIVSRRRRLWHYMEEIKIDNYLSKFVNF
tara:strand:+ start:1232 stop:1771 length:540 start_codon:yes stop_codon:yes gene_type:complete